MERTAPVSSIIGASGERHTMRRPRGSHEQPPHDMVVLGISPCLVARLIPVYQRRACSHTCALWSDTLRAA